ncbi:MAG: hypothetical protein ACMUHM_01990 [Thermoplasmatota archaeon]
MALTPRDPKGAKEEKAEASRKVPWVSWIAITLGVAMTGIGLLLLMWGFMWQADVGEPQSLNGEELRGGPGLIPLGAGMFTVGVLWILTGWRGFKKDRAPDDLMKCPHCGKMIESDLNFCYFCNTTFEEEEEDMEEEEGAGTDAPGKETPPSDTRKRAKPFAPGERP